jgi:hypothetical protein
MSTRGELNEIPDPGDLNSIDHCLCRECAFIHTDCCFHIHIDIRAFADTYSHAYLYDHSQTSIDPIRYA